MGTVRLDDFIDNLLEVEKITLDAVRMDDAVMSQRIPVDINELGNLVDLLEVPESLVEQWEGMGKIGFAEHARGVKLGKFVPFVGTGIEAKHNFDVLMAMRRIQSNDYGENKVQRNRDVQLAQTYLLGLAEEQVRQYSFGGDVARGVAELPAFGLELLMTFGIGTAVKTTAAKGTTVALKEISSKLLRRALARSVGFVAGVAAETVPQVLTRIPKQALEKELSQNLVLTDKGLQISEKAVSKPFQSFMEATADVYIEIATERAGDAFLGPLISKSTNKVVGVFPKKMKDALMKAYTHLHGRAGVNKLFTRVGYNGFITELGEERLGDLIRAITGVGFGPDDGNVWDRLWDSIPSGYEIGVEAAVLTFPGVIKYSSSKMIDMIRKEPGIKEMEAAKPQPRTLSTAEVIQIIEVDTEQVSEKQAVQKQKELSLEEVQEKQARQKAQEDRLSKEKIQRVAVEQVKDEQMKGRLKKLDTDIRIIDREIDSLERERRQLKKIGKPVGRIESKIDTLLKKRDKLDLQRGDILTTAKEQFDLEKEQLEIRGATLTRVAREGIKKVIRAIEKGKQIGREEVQNFQAEALRLLQDLQLDRADQGRFIKTLKNIRTLTQLKTAIPQIVERIEKLEDAAKRRRLVKQIKKAEKAKIASDYKDQIDVILESFDLKERTEKTKRQRESRIQFLMRERQEGNLDFLPPDFFANLGVTTLDQMSTEELEELADQIAILQHVGMTKKRLVAEKTQKDLDTQAQQLAAAIYEATNSTPKQPNIVRWLPFKAKRGLANLLDRIDSFFASHRKVEFIARTLGISQEIFEKIQSGINLELTKTETIYRRLKESFQKFEGEISQMMTEEVELPGVGISLSREQMIGVALNSGNRGNLERLIKGNELTQEEIQIINDSLTDKERAFVDEVFDIVGSLFPDTVATTEKLYGVRPPRVEGSYFPIIEDFKTSDQAQQRQAQEDLFQIIFKTTHINRSFTHRRTGGSAPVNLNVFGLILNHVDGVIHYNALAPQVRDVQKLIKHPLIQQAISETMGENIYNQFPLWLRSVANPQQMRAGNTLEKLAQALRHNATASLLAHRISVSLLQGGSYFQTISEIGIKYGVLGLKDFYQNPRRAIEFVYARSPIMKNRRQTFDRELRDFLRTKRIVGLTRNRPLWNEVMFSWITGIDFMTTMPTWLGAYELGLVENDGNEVAAIQFADGVVRRTQPTGAVENLAEVMKGTQWQKMWTMFMSHFANTHNQLVSAMDRLKYGKAHPLRKASNFSSSLFWLWGAPALLSSIIRSGGDIEDWKKHLKELTLYPVSGILLVRDLMNTLVKGFDFGAPPALSGAVELGRTFKSKDPQKKLRHGIKAIGILSGKIPTQYADTLDGAIDLYLDETDDFRRLFFSEWALKPTSKKKDKRRRRRR